MKRLSREGRSFFISLSPFSCNGISDKINSCIKMHIKILFSVLYYEFKEGDET